MSTVDIIIIITLALSVVIGVMRGFVRQLFGLGGLIVGLVVGSFLYGPCAEILAQAFSMSANAARIVAFVLILIIVPVLCGLLGRLLSRLVSSAGLGFVNRTMGAASGALIWLLLAGVTIHLVEMTGLSDGIEIRESKDDPRKGTLFYGPVRDVSGQCLQWTWNKVRDLDLPVFDSSSKE